MDLLEKTEQDLFEDGINLVEEKGPKNIKGLSYKKNNGKSEIMIFSNNIKSEKEKRTVLIHEQAHCRLDNFYDYLTIDVAERKKIEYQTNVEAIKKHVDPYKLKNLLANGFQIWEISDNLVLEESFIIEAIAYYRLKGII